MIRDETWLALMLPPPPLWPPPEWPALDLELEEVLAVEVLEEAAEAACPAALMVAVSSDCEAAAAGPDAAAERDELAWPDTPASKVFALDGEESRGTNIARTPSERPASIAESGVFMDDRPWRANLEDDILVSSLKYYT